MFSNFIIFTVKKSFQRLCNNFYGVLSLKNIYCIFQYDCAAFVYLFCVLE